VSERLLRISDGSTNNNGQGSEIARYAYDPFGRRIKKTVSQNPSGQGSPGTTLYFYADEGLIAEVDGNAGSTTLGNITTTYGWVPASANTGTWGTAPQWKRDHAGQSGATNPQGDASTNGVEHYYHVDHLGTSQRLTNAQGETTWRMVSEAFGKTFVDATLAPTTTGTTTNNLRFPGQYEDVETGTYYNFMRTYLPTVGRYGESDPIGLKGGLSTYAYVDGNPASGADHLGLANSGWQPSPGLQNLRNWQSVPGNFIYHGNWCGPGWTGGRQESYSTRTSGYKPPVNSLDGGCQRHDVCYFQCRKDFPCERKRRGTCMTTCDRDLAWAAASSGSKYSSPLWWWMRYNNQPDPGENDKNCPGCAVE
jgi:RHS repeat-associated protein